jgi:lipid II:glycine glycyltransferase (peptidoglycan interpeptide bridge formation enzyme)
MPEYTIKEITEENAEKWDEFVKESPQGCIFSSFGWKKIIENSTPFTQKIFGAYDKEKLAGGVVLTEKKQLGHLVALNSLLSPYQGFLLPGTTTSKISDQMSKEHGVLKSLADFTKKRYSQVELNNAPNLTDLRPFILNKWESNPRYTYYLDISSVTSLWSKFDGSVRRTIKKAQKQDFHVGVMNYRTSEIYSLLDMTFTKNGGKNPIPENLVKGILESEILKKNRVCIGARSKEGNLISAIICLWDEKMAYYLIATTNPEFLSTGINSLLIWELAGFLQSMNIKKLDFIGANIPGIARFKECFNPELITFYSLSCWPSSIFKVVKKTGQKILRRK